MSVKINYLSKTTCLLLLLSIIFSSCKKDDDSLKKLPEDISGFWIIAETITGNCHGSVETEQKTEIFSIKQIGNKLTVTIYPNGDKLDGDIDGDKISWKGTLPSGSGNMDIDFTGTATDNGDKATGTASWEWYSSTFRCSGTNTLSGNKVTTGTANFGGEWNGTWESEENSVNGTFSANVTQTDTTLTGTIDVPFVGITNASLKGFVSGNIVYFGDIENKIKFIGTVNGNSGTGTYSYMSLSDEGSWQAARGGAPNTKNLVLVESFPIDEEFMGCTDLTLDGSYFWALSGGKIYKLGMDGSIVSINAAPGNYPTGIAYDGTNLLVGDNNWGTGKIYKLETSVNSILELPGSGNIVGASRGSTGLWCADDETDAPMVYKIDWNGEITHSFPVQGRSVKGLCFDGANLWISYRNYEIFDNNKIAKLDTLGNLLKIIDPPVDESGGITFDGKHLWYHVGDTFYKMDTLGNVDKSISSPVVAGGDITFDGQYLWCVNGEYEEQSKLYQLDTLGNEISSFNCPGSNQKGLAFDGTHLRLADRITKKLYRLPLDGDYYMNYPSFDIQYLSSDANVIFTNNISTDEIVLIDKSGGIVNSFNCPTDMMLTGMSYNGENLWLVDNIVFDLNRLIKMDIDGNILDTYKPTEKIPAANSLTVYGDDIWCITYDNTESFYRLSKFELSD